MTSKDYKERLKEMSIEERKEMYRINKHDVELIKIMIKMQEKLDEQILKEHNISEINEDFLNIAILDEIGELTHELKGEWCWWKNTQAPVDKEKVLEELVDIWHFVLSHSNHFVKKDYIYEKQMSRINDQIKVCCSEVMRTGFADKLVSLIKCKNFRIIKLIFISLFLGFSVEDVYKAYCDKNKVNYQRLKEGY